MIRRLPPGLSPLPPPGKERQEEQEEEAVELDLRDEVCPYTFLKARLALEPMASGAVLRVLVGNEASVHDVPRSLADAGHAVLATESAGTGLWAIIVRKGRS